MPPTNSLSVTTATKVHQLRDFLHSAENEGRLHAKIGADGSSVLYVSKGKGTGFKQALFPKKFEARKIAARLAILAVTGSNNTEQSAALYASIASGYIPKELNEGNSAVEVIPLIVGELKSKISNQINLDQQALAEKYLDGIELDFENGKARTPFSAQNEKTSPLANGLQDAMEGIRDAAHKLSGSDRQKLQRNTQTFINDNLQNCPFHATHEYEEIIDFSLNFDKNTNKLLKEIFDGPRDDKKAEDATIALSDNFKKLKFSANLLTNEAFIASCPKTKRDAMLKLGKQLSALHELLHQPQGFYTSLGALTGLAINSPADFRRCLDKFKSNFLHANLPDGAIANEN